jgi:hypothetical protein
MTRQSSTSRTTPENPFEAEIKAAAGWLTTMVGAEIAAPVEAP